MTFSSLERGTAVSKTVATLVGAFRWAFQPQDPEKQVARCGGGLCETTGREQFSLVLD